MRHGHPTSKSNSDGAMPRGMSERLRGILCTPESPIFKAIAPLAVDPVMDPMHPVNMDPMTNGLSTSGKICVSSCIPVFNRKINRENYLYSTATVRFPLPVSTKWMAITPPNMHRVHQGIPLGVAGQISPSPPRCDPPHKTSFRFAWFLLMSGCWRWIETMIILVEGNIYRIPAFPKRSEK